MKLIKKLMVFLILFGAISTPSHAAYDFSLDDNIDENELMMVKAQLQDELEVINQKLSSKIMDPEITGKLEAEKLALEGVVRRLQVVEWWHSAGKKRKNCGHCRFLRCYWSNGIYRVGLKQTLVCLQRKQKIAPDKDKIKTITRQLKKESGRTR